MKRAAFKLVSKPIYFLATIIARRLPPLHEKEAIAALPPSPVLAVRLPVNYTQLPLEFAKRFTKTKRFPQQHIFVLDNVYINRWTIVFKNLKIYHRSLPWEKDLVLYRQGRFLLRQWLSKKQTVPNNEIAALVFDQWSVRNYYHWMIESLQRLMFLKMHYPNAYLIVPHPASNFITSTISALGFNKIKFLDRESPDVLKVSKLLFPQIVYADVDSELATSDNIPPSPHKVTLPKNFESISYEEPILTVRKTLLAHYSPTPVIPKKRTYISRAKQTKRRLLNEEEIKPVLEKYGFDTVYFEDMSFTEQIAIMFETKIFLGLHGANMVNILFMQEGAKVIELMNKDFLNDAYYLLASSVKLPYYSVPCTMADKSIKPTDDMIILNDADVLVDKDRLEETILMALNEEKDSAF